MVPVSTSVFAGTITQSTTATVNKVLSASADWVSIILDVTAVSGASATATFRVQWSMDGATFAEASPPDAFAPITGPVCVVERFAAKAPYWRAVCDLTGTDPSFTGSANSYS